MASRTRLTIIVPTVGRSPYLLDCLQALTSVEQIDAETLVAADERVATTLRCGSARVIPVPAQAGFAGACNRALSQSRSDYVAVVNDDVVVEPGWSVELVSALKHDTTSAGVQGTNLSLEDRDRIDGCGIGWNQHWQAVQIDRGKRPAADGPTREVFGVSGTAAIFSRRALDEAALAQDQAFDPVLNTYYEDVELACRLRARGFRALHVPWARANHAGSTSSSGNPMWRYRQIYGNRLLVLARLWGRRFLLRLPGVLYRDCVDLTRAAMRLDRDQTLGILSGWRRAVRHLRTFAHSGPPLIPQATLRPYQLNSHHGLGID